MLSTPVLQYYCGSCNTILKETEHNIHPSYSLEPCPHCGMILSNTLQKTRALTRKPKPPPPIFKKASALPKLTLDIPQLDDILHFLTQNQIVCIRGAFAQKLVERLCVRAQLPHRYGGLDTDVLLIDGANSSDLYQCVDFAQQYGLDARKVLSKIVTSRCFTVYQLANLITCKLEDAVNQLKWEGKPVVAGEKIRYVLHDYSRKISKRVVPLEIVDSEGYDVKRYSELLDECCKSVIEPFEC